jgi:hypothetical protein
MAVRGSLRSPCRNFCFDLPVLPSNAAMQAPSQASSRPDWQHLSPVDVTVGQANLTGRVVFHEPS